MNRMLFLSHEPPLAPHDLWSAWNTEPAILIPLVLTALIYFVGTLHIWQRQGLGHGITVQRVAGFLGALLALLLAFVSPLDALSDALFSAHMIQHLILILLAAPLLVISDFPLAFLWMLPRPQAQELGRRWNLLSRLWNVISRPVSAWLLFTLTVWLWHAPIFFEAALQNENLHSLEHLCFLVAASLFWWVLLKHAGPKYLRYGLAVPYLFTTILQSGLLGALMTFSSLPWYPFYADLVRPWHLTTLQDQQLAGLIMWVPGGIVFTLLTIGYFAAFLRILESRNSSLPRSLSLRTRQEQNGPNAN